MKELIKEKLLEISNELGLKPKAFSVEEPPKSQAGDWATNIAMTAGGNPRENAQKIVEKLDQDGIIEKAEIAGPGFINIFLTNDYLLGLLKEVIQNKNNYGASGFGGGKKVALEHTNVNPNKALHIGHLRNACLGSCCQKVLERMGYDVEVQYYVDDTGVQVAVTYLGMISGSNNQEIDQKFDHIAQDVYVETMDLIERDDRYKSKQEEIIHELDKQSGSNVLPVKQLAEKIIKCNLETMGKFNISYDLLVWESDIIKEGFWKQALEVLKKNADVFVYLEEGKNTGCWVMKNILGDDKVIVKSNGVATYAGKDIAYHLWKFNLLGKDFKYKRWCDSFQKKLLCTTSTEGETSNAFGKADMVVNFIDVRQTFPQQAVLESLKALGYKKQSENLVHIGYGIVFLSPKTASHLGIDISDRKNKYAMSGRKGVGILVDDLFELVRKAVKTAYPESAVADQVSVGAIKYHMLKFNPLSDIIFDLDQALDFHGNSGPYLQYTYARTNSVLSKAKGYGKNIELDQSYRQITDQEKDIINSLAGFSLVVLEAGKEFSPNIICTYLFELCQKYNAYYGNNTIVSTREESATDNFRILLTAAVNIVLMNGLNLLGIPVIDRM